MLILPAASPIAMWTLKSATCMDLVGRTLLLDAFSPALAGQSFLQIGRPVVQSFTSTTLNPVTSIANDADASSSTIVGPVAGGIAGGIFILLFIAAVVILARNRKPKLVALTFEASEKQRSRAETDSVLHDANSGLSQLRAQSSASTYEEPQIQYDLLSSPVVRYDALDAKAVVSQVPSTRPGQQRYHKLELVAPEGPPAQRYHKLDLVPAPQQTPQGYNKLDPRTAQHGQHYYSTPVEPQYEAIDQAVNLPMAVISWEAGSMTYDEPTEPLVRPLPTSGYGALLTSPGPQSGGAIYAEADEGSTGAHTRRNSAMEYADLQPGHRLDPEYASATYSGLQPGHRVDPEYMSTPYSEFAPVLTAAVSGHDYEYQDPIEVSLKPNIAYHQNTLQGSGSNSDHHAQVQPRKLEPSTSAPWLVHDMSRTEAERLLSETGKIK